MSQFQGLDPKMIDQLMSNTRSRNTYGPKLLEFHESDEAGINVREVWVEFKNKKVTALYQGFMNAVKNAEMEDDILVKQYDGQVYLLHKQRAIVALSPADETAEDESDDSNDDAVSE